MVRILSFIVPALLLLGTAGALEQGGTPVATADATSARGLPADPPRPAGPGGGKQAQVGAAPARVGAARLRVGQVWVGPSPLDSLVPRDPVRLAAQLATVENSIRNPATTPRTLARMGQLEQLDYGTLSAHPGWQAAVLAHLPAGLRRQAALILDASSQLQLLDAGFRPSNQLPPWDIISPQPSNVLLGDYRAASAATGVPWMFLAGINLVETRMGRIRGNSPAGAQGPMQFIPTTWAIYGAGGNVNSPRDAIAAAARLLRASGAPADMALALYHYNPSMHYARAVSDYAAVMASNPRAYLGFYQWQVYVTTLQGDFVLPVGYRGG